MVVYPVKWLPYMFIIGGIYVLVAEEDFVTALFLVGVGVAWLYIKKKFLDSKNKVTNTQATNTQTTTMQTANPNVNYSSTTSVQNFCTNCGFKIKPGDLFCENCGKKLNG